MQGIGDTGFDFADIVDDVVERSGGQTATAADVVSIRRSLPLVLTKWSTFYPLWQVRDLTTGGYGPRIELPGDVDDVLTVSVRRLSELPGVAPPIRRISLSEYRQLASPHTAGRPSQWALERGAKPALLVYPTGEDPVGYELQVSYVARPARFNRLEDPDNGEIAGRWIAALILELAADRARKSPPYDDQLIARLTAEAQAAYDLAALNDRDRAPYRHRITRRRGR